MDVLDVIQKPVGIRELAEKLAVLDGKPEQKKQLG